MDSQSRVDNRYLGKLREVRSHTGNRNSNGETLITIKYTITRPFHNPFTRIVSKSGKTVGIFRQSRGFCQKTATPPTVKINSGFFLSLAENFRESALGSDDTDSKYTA